MIRQSMINCEAKNAGRSPASVRTTGESMKKERSLRDRIGGYILKKYGAEPERMWMRFPDYAVFRHDDGRRWFGIIMDVPREKLGLEGEGRIDVINVKTDDPLLAEVLLHRKGFLPGYHQDHNKWITVLLDGTVPFKEICALVDASYIATASAKKKRILRPKKEWIIPANPKYYDVVRAFDGGTEIDWKQGAGIREGDTVFVYAAAPVSAILYKCTVTKTDIPFDYRDGGLTITALMRIRLEKRYDPGAFTFKRLRDEFGLFAVRGPRGLPFGLGEALELYEGI